MKRNTFRYVLVGLVFLILLSVDILYKPYLTGTIRIIAPVSLTKTNEANSDIPDLLTLLNELDTVIKHATTEDKVYGNIFSGKSTQQLQSYISFVKDFNKLYPIQTICEIGFAGGHSATLFLHLTDSVTTYTAFDIWDKPVYEEKALAWIKNKFKNRKITIIKGDSTKTVPQYKGTCDVIHIDGAHHANFPKTEMVNMARLASANNLLLVDDCTASWPSVLKGVEYLQQKNLVYNMTRHIASGWSHRGAQKGWCSGYYNKPPPISTYNYTSVTFLNKKLCLPSWNGENCNIYRPKTCTNFSDECFYNDVSGVLSVSCDRWRAAQKLRQETRNKHDFKLDEKEINEVLQLFDNYKALPKDLGNVIEIKSSPLMYSEKILRDKTASGITFVEPVTSRFTSNVTNNFSFNMSRLNFPTTFISMDAEDLNKTRKFDTLIMINALDCVYDALSNLKAAIDLIKDNGLFIWHNKVWDNYSGLANASNDPEFRLYPIRIKSVVAKQVLTAFDPMFVSWKTGEEKLKHNGIYFIGRKRKTNLVTNITQTASCIEKDKGRQTIIFFISNSNATAVLQSINITNASSNVKTIIIILTDIVSDQSMSSLLAFRKIQVVISHLHLTNWKNELSNYIEPCFTIYPLLSVQMLNDDSAVCIGNSLVSVVLMGYSTKRLPNYDLILEAYGKMSIIDQIILVWNNKNESFATKSGTPFTLIQPDSNSMNNRFNVSHVLRTEAVLIIDDDVMISNPLLSLMLLRWSENTDRLVGLDRRYVTPNNEYAFTGKNPSLVLGKTMLFHRKYLDSYMQDKVLVEWNRDKYCEDISMNALIYNATRLKPLFVPMTRPNTRRTLPETDGASIAVASAVWIERRHVCVRWVSQHFNIQLF